MSWLPLFEQLPRASQDLPQCKMEPFFTCWQGMEFTILHNAHQLVSTHSAHKASKELTKALILSHAKRKRKRNP